MESFRNSNSKEITFYSSFACHLIYKKMMRLETTGSKTVENFLNGSENQCESTAKEYRKRLDLFARFVYENYDSLTLDQLIETLTKEGRGRF
jgi:hypothetical protein